MAKPKQKQKKNNSSPKGSEGDPQLDDNWVMVKKQKITILIPPLPVTKQVAIANPEESNPQTVLPKKTSNTQPVVTKQPAITEKLHPVFEKEKSIPLTASVPLPGPVQPIPNLTPNLIPNLGRRTIGLENRKLDAPKFSLLRTKRSTLCICSKYEGVLVNNSIRALNVERKLRRAGGLRRWLVSMGLGQFVRIFQGKCVGKFQLVNLTMKKLKDMGAVAVGPRRKLIHALDCLCQPHCYHHL